MEAKLAGRKERWAQRFEEKHGRKPTRADIKANPRVAKVRV